MIGAKAKTRFDRQKIRRKAEAGNYRSIGHAAASVRTIGRRSIRKRKGPSPKGRPPHTHKKRLPASILYHVDRRAGRAVIGPSHRIIGIVGGVHERGEEYKGHDYAARPFMGPALEKAKPRIPKHWAGSIA